jgi:hypothetical protein
MTCYEVELDKNENEKEKEKQSKKARNETCNLYMHTDHRKEKNERQEEYRSIVNSI